MQIRVATRQAAKISFWVSSSGVVVSGISTHSKRCSIDVRCLLKDRMSSFVVSDSVEILLCVSASTLISLNKFCSSTSGLWELRLSFDTKRGVEIVNVENRMSVLV